MTTVYRRFSVATRDSVFSGQINGAPDEDAVSHGYYRFAYDNSTGSYSDVLPGMTIEFGSTPGARDIGMTRVRKAPTSTLMYIAETAAGKLPIANNLYFTVRNEYLPWRVLPRGVGSSTGGATYTNDMTLYMDYEIAYSDQNEKIPPKANITRSALSLLPPKPAGNLDAGQTYRTIVLSAAQSFSFYGSIASVLWDVEDCTISTGTSSSTTITVRVPEGFRYIHLTVTDSNGKTSVMHFPLWAHGDTFQPIVNFKVTSDETSELGRNMSFEFFGPDDMVNAAALPRMGLICYWEEEDSTRPDDYRDQYIGWAKRESTLLRLYRTRYTLETSGIAGWLDAYSGSSLYIYDPLEIPDKWYEMRSMTIDKCAFFILNYFSTALTICNLHLSGNSYPTKGETIEMGSVWRQVVEMVNGYYGVAGADSLNGIWLRKHFCYLTTDERNAVASLGTVTRTDLTDDVPVVFKNELINKIGLVIGGGSSFNSTENTIFASAAPGLTPGDVSGEEQAPGQRLPTSGAQTELNRVTGHRYAFLNNPNSDIVFEFQGNDDIYEPAFMRPFTYQEDMGNVAGTTVNKRFIPRSINITHSNRVGEKPKQISMTAYGETFGNPGEDKPVPVYDTDSPPVLIEPAPIGTPPPTSEAPALMSYTTDVVPTRMYIAASGSSQAAIATSVTLGGTFIWTEISTGLGGFPIWASSDPWNYSRIFQLTTTGLYTCTPYNFTGWTLVATNLTMFGNATYVGTKIMMSINRKGWIYIISGASMSAWSSNYGVTWSNNGGSGGTGGGVYNQDVVISPFNDGASAVGWMYRCLYTGPGGITTFYKSTDWGQTWSVISTKNLWAWFTPRMNIPYKKGDGTDNVNNSSQWLYIADGGGNTGALWKSTDSSLTYSAVRQYNSAATRTPTSSNFGTSIQTFTYDGDVVIVAALLPLTQGGLQISDGTNVLFDGNTHGSSTNYQINVNGFSYHRGAALVWNHGGGTALLKYTFDSGANIYNVNLPAFFTGSQHVAYAEWPLIDYVIG